jgi:Oligoendopeptidase F
MLAGKVEDMLNTVVRQIAFYDFESAAHGAAPGRADARRDRRVWMAVQSREPGAGLHLRRGVQNFWSYIGHFIHSPFYVYAYAFGDCLVNSLYAAYQSGLPDFQAKYLDMLKRAA